MGPIHPPTLLAACYGPESAASNRRRTGQFAAMNPEENPASGDYWQASQVPPLRIASIEHAAFSSAVYCFGASAPWGNGGVDSSPEAVSRAAVSAPVSPAAPRISFFTCTVAFSMFEAPSPRR